MFLKMLQNLYESLYDKPKLPLDDILIVSFNQESTKVWLDTFSETQTTGCEVVEKVLTTADKEFLLNALPDLVKNGNLFTSDLGKIKTGAIYFSPRACDLVFYKPSSFTLGRNKWFSLHLKNFYENGLETHPFTIQQCWKVGQPNAEQFFRTFITPRKKA